MAKRDRIELSSPKIKFYNLVTLEHPNGPNIEIPAN